MWFTGTGIFQPASYLAFGPLISKEWRHPPVSTFFNVKESDLLRAEKEFDDPGDLLCSVGGKL